MVEPVSGPTKVEKCGVVCVDVWVGQIGDNYWRASCAFFEASSVYSVVSPDAITDARLEAVYWNDYIQVFVDGNNVFDAHPKRGAANLRVGFASAAVFRGAEHLHSCGGHRHLRLQRHRQRAVLDGHFRCAALPERSGRTG